MSNTISLETIKNTSGVTGVTRWERNGIVRNYVNFAGHAVSKVWEQNGKLHIQIRKGRDSDEALAAMKALIGCSIVDRYSKAANYVIVK